MIIKLFYKMMNHKKDKNEYEKKFEKAIAASYDFSSREYVKPLVGYVKEGK